MHNAVRNSVTPLKSIHRFKILSIDSGEKFIRVGTTVSMVSLHQ